MMRLTCERPSVSLFWGTLGVVCLIAGTAVAGSNPPKPPVSYVQDNQGTLGFLDTGGVRLRTETGARGIKIGDFVLWPNLVIEGRYDSNFFREDASEEPTPTPVIRIRPALAVTNPNPSKVALNLGLGAALHLYPSGEEGIRRQGNVGVTGDFKLGILPRGPVTVWLIDNFRRTLNSAFAESSNSFNTNKNRAGLTVSIHPGGGALDVQVGYRYGLMIFDDYDQGDYQHHDFVFRTTWRFYPKTLAFVEASTSLWDWERPPAFDGLSVDNKQTRIYAGLSGFVTKRIATIAKIGYGNSFHDAGPSFENVIGQFEFIYKFTDRFLAAAGYVRDFRTGLYANYFRIDRPYLRGQAQFGRVTLDAMAAFGILDYAFYDPAASDPVAARTYQVLQTERRDYQALGHFNVSIGITRWMSASLGYELVALLTDFGIKRFREVDANTTLETLDPGQYVRHQVYGSVNFRY